MTIDRLQRKTSQTEKTPPFVTTVSKSLDLWLCVLVNDPGRTPEEQTPAADPITRRQPPRQTRFFREIPSRYP